MAEKISHTLPALDIEKVRADFPILATQVHGKQLVYFDNAATGQKPAKVIETVDRYYRELNSNVHRGVHHLSDLATRAYEEVRGKIQHWLNAEHEHEIILTKGTTDAINLVAAGFAKKFLKEGDEIILSGMEHHSNIVPWQLAAEDAKATVRPIPVLDDGSLDMDAFQGMLNERTALVAVVHTSNTLGTVNPVQEIIEAAHAQDIPVLLDAAQAAPHEALDVRALDCDFLALSSHKVFGPTGVGVLYGKEKWLNALPPYQGGGDMIDEVTFEKTTYNTLPHKFEAGTPNIVGVIGLGAAIDYIQEIGYEAISAHEQDLLEYGTRRILEVEGVRIIGTAAHKASVISFVVDGVHPADLGMLLNVEGIAIRTGHHCTQPLMKRFEVSSTARASFAFYNTREEIDRFIEALRKAIGMFK